MKKMAVFGALALTMTMASVASAGEGEDYVTQDEKDGYRVDFMDSDLQGGTLNGNLPMIKVRPHTVRMTLIRPRTSFVQEMLKSVDTL